MSTLLYFDQATDRDLESRVSRYLHGLSRPAPRRVHVRAKDGTVTLAGKVPSFYDKQLALNCCRRVAGVVRLVDEVEVLTA
jgi:osmotically-inducible protein OsmY